MSDSITSAIDALVDWAKAHEGPSFGEKAQEELKTLDATLYVLCQGKGLTIPQAPCPPSKHLSPFGFCALPHGRASCREGGPGMFVFATDDWQQAMRGLRAIAANRKASGSILPENPPPNDAAIVCLLKVFTNGVSDERIKKASVLLMSNSLTVDEKLTRIDALIRFPATASGKDLGDMLGVKKQAVYQTGWWTQNRKGEKQNETGRRRVTHRERANRYESTDREDEK